MATDPDFPIRVDQVDQALQHIAVALQSCEAEFLFGAGMSMDSGLPSGRRLARELLDAFFPVASPNRPSEDELNALVDLFPFEALVQGVEHGLNDRKNLTKVLQRILLDPRFKPTEAHSLFHKICFWEGVPRIRQIFTTNYDTLLEQKFDGGAEAVSEKNVRNLRAIIDSRKIPIIHLHGLLTDEYEITEKDVFDDRFRIVANDFRSALISAEAFVFVGYSMSDPDFRRIYNLYREDIATRGDANKKTYVVMPTTAVAYRFGAPLWDTRGAVWLPFTASEFFRRLQTFLDGHVQEKVRSEISQKYGLRDRASFDSLVNKTAETLDITTTDAIQFLLAARNRAEA